MRSRTSRSEFAPEPLLRQKPDGPWQNFGKSRMGDLELIFDGALARIRFNAPARRNAINRAIWRALPEACAAIEARADALVVVVEGAGGHFSAGADIGEFDVVYRDAEATRDYVDSMQAAFSALAALDRPTIAAIEGSAIGGGLAVALVLRSAFRRRRRASGGAAGQARPGLRPDRDEPAGRARRPGARQGSAVQRPPRRAGRGAGDRPRRPRRPRRRAQGERRSLCRRARRLEPALDPRRQAHRRRARRRPRARRARRSGAEVEDAALGEDFGEGRAAFAGKRAPRFAFRGATKALS